MSENQASKVQEKNPEKETSIPEETISDSVSAEFEENSINELKEDDIPKNIPTADDSSSRVNKSDLESAGFTLDEFASLLSKYCLLYTSPSPRDRTRSRMPSSA